MIDLHDRKTRLKTTLLALFLLLAFILVAPILIGLTSAKPKDHPIAPPFNQTITNQTYIYYIENKTIIVYNTTIINVYPEPNTTIEPEPTTIEPQSISDVILILVAFLSVMAIVFIMGFLVYDFYKQRRAYLNKTNNHKTLTFYELEERDTDGSFIRYYKTIEDDEDEGSLSLK